MKVTTDNWIELLIGIAIVVGAYYYLTNATAKREAKLLQMCMEDMAEEIKEDVKREAYCFDAMGI